MTHKKDETKRNIDEGQGDVAGGDEHGGGREGSRGGRGRGK
jgi:hypothetical protein